MKTVVLHIARCTIKEFADRHGLVMKINEWNVPLDHPQRSL